MISPAGAPGLLQVTLTPNSPVAVHSLKVTAMFFSVVAELISPDPVDFPQLTVRTLPPSELVSSFRAPPLIVNDTGKAPSGSALGWLAAASPVPIVATSAS